MTTQNSDAPKVAKIKFASGPFECVVIDCDKKWSLDEECIFVEKHAYDQAIARAETANLLVESLEEEVSELKFSLKQKSDEIGRYEHRGNTVDYIYDKCATYGRIFDEQRVKIESLEDEVKRLEKQLRFCAGYLSANEEFEHCHLEEVLEWIKDQALEGKE